uniref:Mediator of RNA polymerase II transcription subunit 26 n=1 Tax=Heterorhabditis bacteriophora TaxID=37862 RepID=A0A1I7XQI8_HETBA
MVACAAVATQPPVSLAVPMTPCTLTVEQLKQHLLSAIENGKCETACDVLSELEKVPINKEILESTRVGAIVNDVRKKTVEQWPLLSKRCRALIKAWQKLVEVRPTSSGTSSANGTPNLVSPGAAKLSRRVTPCTPVNRRVTSTGMSAGRSTTVSPANSSYAPKELSSPTNGVLHKSQSVGADLLSRGDDIRNGKRKADDVPAVVPFAMKRTKTAIGSLASPASTASTPQSVLAARKAVQSTTELVAQLSQNLPEHMSIDSSIREHEEKVKREQQDEELAMQLYGGASTSSPYIQIERKKENTRGDRNQLKFLLHLVSAPEERRGGLILRLPRIAPIKEDTQEDIQSPLTSRPTSSLTRPESAGSSKVDWFAMLPSLDELKSKAEQIRAVRAEPDQHDPTKAYLMRVKERDVLALPYLDVPIKPDFIQYRYPDGGQYYAEENFSYGAVRPS